MTGGWKRWPFVILIALVLAYLGVMVASDDADGVGILSGWAVATASSVVALFLNRRAIGADSTVFLRYGLLANGVRFLTVAATLLCFSIVSDADYVSYAVALVVSYLAFMCYEIWVLHTAGMAGAVPGRSEKATGGRAGVAE